MAYVYRLTHKIDGRFYIGYRVRNDVDLGVKYFSSSKYINSDNFHEFSPEIIASGLERDAAYDLEQRLIFNDWNHPLIMNESCYHEKRRFRNKPGYSLDETFRKRRSELTAGQNNPMYGKRGELSPLYGRKRPDQSEFMKNNNPTKGLPRSEQIKREHSERMKGRPSPHKGKTFEEIHGDNANIRRQKISEALKGRKQPMTKVTCPHCGKIGGVAPMHRFHFDRCRSNI
jgi:hypothetical protein